MASANPFISASISVGRELAEVAERLRRCTVRVRGAGHGMGSGVIWRSDGLIITNAHVTGSSRHTIQLADGRVFHAELVRRDPQSDLALLRIEALGLPAAQVRDPGSLRPGELLLAVGNPLEAAGALAMGVVSATPKAGDMLMCADIRLAPGNSGGPLADVEGKVAGINSMVVDGFGVAVTSTVVASFLDGAGRIGVTLHPVMVRVERVPLLGLLVAELEPGGAAHLSGVLAGDVIVAVNGSRLRSPAQLAEAARVASREFSVDVLRAGRMESCHIVPARTQDAEAA